MVRENPTRWLPPLTVWDTITTKTCNKVTLGKLQDGKARRGSLGDGRKWGGTVSGACRTPHLNLFVNQVEHGHNASPSEILIRVVEVSCWAHQTLSLSHPRIYPNHILHFCIVAPGRLPARHHPRTCHRRLCAALMRVKLFFRHFDSRLSLAERETLFAFIYRW